MIEFEHLAVALKSRNGALAAASVAATLIMLAFALPLILLFQAQDTRTEDSLRELGRLHTRAAIEPALRRELNELHHEASGIHGSLPNNSGPLAQSQLQQAMESLAATGGASIRSSQMLSTGKQSGFESIAIQYELTVPMSKLRDLVYAVETQVPYLFLDEVQISAGERGQSTGAASAEPLLNIRWKVSAYRWDGGS